MFEKGLGCIGRWWEGAGSRAGRSPAEEGVSITGTTGAAGGKHPLPGAQQ